MSKERVEIDPAKKPVFRTGPRGVWIEQRLDGPWSDWMVASRIIPDDRGQPAVAELRVFPYQPNTRTYLRPAGQWDQSRTTMPRGGLPATLLRRGIQLGEQLEAARVALRGVAAIQHARLPSDHPVSQLPWDLRDVGFELGAAKTVSETSRRGRPRRWEADDYARVALTYDDAVRAGRSPVEAVQKAERVTPSIAANLIARARSEKYQFIPPIGKSKSYNLPTLSEDARRTLAQVAKGRNSRARKQR